MSENLDDILDSIEKGECVLVLGPELCLFKDKSFYECMDEEYKDYYEALPDRKKKQFGNQKINFVNYSFVNEELLEITSTSGATQAKEFVKQFYEQRTEWQPLFEKIACIPFPLVISLLADESLHKTYESAKENNNLDFTYSRYSRTNSLDVTPVDYTPSKGKPPLVYNLLGSLDRGDAVLTFNDWFLYFRNILGKGLPVQILTLLHKNPVFLFLGVRFERWYIQLLIRILIMKDGDDFFTGKKFSMSMHANEEVGTLIWNRFELEYDTTNPTVFLEQLYQGCQERNLLRTMNSKPSKLNAKVFISYNHKDKIKANQVKIDLEKAGIEVIIDDGSMLIGQDINDFINQSIKDGNFILLIISKSSLTSPWVGQELIKTFLSSELFGKLILPCNVDKCLSDSTFSDEAFKEIEDKIQALDNQISGRRAAKRSILDLNEQLERWTDLKNNFDKNIYQLKKKLRADLMDEDYTSGIDKVINTIKIHMDKKNNS